VIYCTVERVLGGGAVVRSFDEEEQISTREFSTLSEATATLRYSGFIEVNNRWVAVLTTVPYVATHVAKTTPITQELMLFNDDVKLVMNIVEGVAGYAFKFAIDMLHLDGNRDPLMAILTSELVTVEAIGSWPTTDEAEAAGRAFFKRVLELIPKDLLLQLLYMVKERWICQTKNSR